MADDLVDDYWIQEDVVDDTPEPSNDDASSEQIEKKKKKKKKDKQKQVLGDKVDDIDTGEVIDYEKAVKAVNIEHEGIIESEKDKKKKKRKRKSENVTGTEVVTPVSKKKKKKKAKHIEEYEPTLEGMWKFFQGEFQKTLSDIEIQDIKPENSDWCLTESEPVTRDNIQNFPLYLKDIAPSWEESCSTLSRKEIKGSR